MTPKEIKDCLEQAFGSLQPPLYEELTYSFGMGPQFEEAVRTETARTKRWQELRPLRRYFYGTDDITLLAAEATRYYLPAYLYGLMDEDSEKIMDEGWLMPILNELFYENEYGDPLFNKPDLRERWAALTGLLTDEQKRCIAHWLIEVVKRIDDPNSAVELEIDRIEYILDKYWRQWL